MRTFASVAAAVFVLGCSTPQTGPKDLERVERIEQRIGNLEEDVNGAGCMRGLREEAMGLSEEVAGLRNRIVQIELKVGIDIPEEDMAPAPPYEPEDEGHEVQVKLKPHDRSLLVEESED